MYIIVRGQMTEEGTCCWAFWAIAFSYFPADNVVLTCCVMLGRDGLTCGFDGWMHLGWGDEVMGFGLIAVGGLP